MSRIGLSVVVLTLLAATAAYACCLFKCCSKPSNDDRSIKTSSVTPLIRINSIDSQAPMLNDIPGEVNHPKIDVIVEIDFDPGPTGPDLNVTDDGVRTAAVAVAATVAKSYRPKRLMKVPRPKPVTAPVPTPGPAPGPIPGPTPDPQFFWQAVYTIDVDAKHNYRAYATATSVSSSTITFRTKP